MRFSARLFKDQFKLVVAGGGAAGNAIAQYFSRTIAVSQLAVIDSSDKIYYQPGFSFIGANMIKPKDVVKNRIDYHPDLVRWYKTDVKEFAPTRNSLVLGDGSEIGYEFLVIATGCQKRFDLVEGLPEAFKSPGVCSIYSYELAQKTRDEIQNFTGGNCIFTHPKGHVTCAGEPQKICYLAEEIFNKRGIRDDCTLRFITALDKLFDVPRYEKTLEEEVKKKRIIVNTHRNLTKVDSTNKTAFFEQLDGQGNPTGDQDELEYELLHVVPSCLPIQPLVDSVKSKDGLVDEEGWVDVHPVTLQSSAFPNVFALGDCCNAPTSKTAAAASTQFRVVKHNLTNAMNGREFSDEYDGYSSCPLMTDSKHVALAEFNYRGPIETTPLQQSKPRYASYLLARYIVPAIYWKLFLRGLWNGPKGIRKFLHLGFSK